MLGVFCCLSKQARKRRELKEVSIKGSDIPIKVSYLSCFLMSFYTDAKAQEQVFQTMVTKATSAPSQEKYHGRRKFDWYS